MEYVNLDIKELNNIWSLMGLKYMPSVLYKLKLLSFTNSLIREEVSMILGNASQKTSFKSDDLDQAAKDAIDSLGKNFFTANN